MNSHLEMCCYSSITGLLMESYFLLVKRMQSLEWVKTEHSRWVELFTGSRDTLRKVK